jgi:uncharacterized membrane protein YfcA
MVMVLAGSVAVLLGFGQVDLSVITPLWLVALPIGLVGVVIGNRIASGIPARHMKRAMALLLAISGLAPMRHMLT